MPLYCILFHYSFSSLHECTGFGTCLFDCLEICTNPTGSYRNAFATVSAQATFGLFSRTGSIWSSLLLSILCINMIAFPCSKIHLQCILDLPNRSRYMPLKCSYHIIQTTYASVCVHLNDEVIDDIFSPVYQQQPKPRWEWANIFATIALSLPLGCQQVCRYYLRFSIPESNSLPLSPCTKIFKLTSSTKI